MFETGTNRWRIRRLAAAPAPRKRPHLHAGGGLSFQPAGRGRAAGEPATRDVSDPARPVPYIAETAGCRGST